MRFNMLTDKKYLKDQSLEIRPFNLRTIQPNRDIAHLLIVTFYRAKLLRSFLGVKFVLCVKYLTFYNLRHNPHRHNQCHHHHQVPADYNSQAPSV